MKQQITIFLIFFTSLLSALKLETIFGKTEVNEPLLVELIESKAVQRLKHVDQHGHAHLKKPRPSFSRYDHSIGVLQLLRRFGASLDAQVTGLLHDVSHTAFSHVGNLVFEHIDGKDSYQDTIHDWHLRRNGIEPILKKYKISVESVCTTADYPLLERDLPDISAHRLEYILRTAYAYGFLTTEEVAAILDNVEFDGERWFFTNEESAQKVANYSLYFTENLWGADWNYASHIFLSRAIKRALDLHIVTFSDVHHQTDAEVLAKLSSSSDQIIQESLAKSINAEETLAKNNKRAGQHHASPKFRGINPWIKKEGKFMRLCDAKPSYAKEFNRVRLKMARGYFFTI